MWFNKSKPEEIEVEEPQHWPTERVILERPNLAALALPEDLEGLDEVALAPIAQVCEVDQFAPDECVSCLAHTMILELRNLAEQEDSDPYSELLAPGMDTPLDPDGLLAGDNVVELFTESDLQAEVPVAEQFASKVAELSVLVEELLEGPPIPPPNVSLAELSLLLLAADKWVKMSEIQGGLLPEQQRMLDATRELVARLRS